MEKLCNCGSCVRVCSPVPNTERVNGVPEKLGWKTVGGLPGKTDMKPGTFQKRQSDRRSGL